MKHRSGSWLVLLIVITATALIAAGCGSDDSENSKVSTASKTKSEQADEKSMTASDDESKAEPMRARLTSPADGVTLQVKSSEFGDVLFDGNGQVVYAFENDTKGVSNCSGECAEFWPPVLTTDGATAGDGARDSLLGTIERADGGTQVTYAGRPLYFVNEPAGEIHCQNQDMHGGLWWVVGADGKPITKGQSKMM